MLPEDVDPRRNSTSYPSHQSRSPEIDDDNRSLGILHKPSFPKRRGVVYPTGSYDSPAGDGKMFHNPHHAECIHVHVIEEHGFVRAPSREHWSQIAPAPQP